MEKITIKIDVSKKVFELLKKEKGSVKEAAERILETALANPDSKLVELADENSALKAEILKLKERIETLEKEKSELEEKFKKAKKKLDKTKESLKAKSEQLISLEEKLKEQEVEIKKLKDVKNILRQVESPAILNEAAAIINYLKANDNPVRLRTTKSGSNSEVFFEVVIPEGVFKEYASWLAEEKKKLEKKAAEEITKLWQEFFGRPADVVAEKFIRVKLF